jgi:uncharacterized RDD family membrane protein YckC
VNARWTIKLVLLGVLLGVWADVAASADRLLVSGSDRALWLIQSGPDTGRFDLVARPAGGKWQWVVKDRSGTPVAAVAEEASLHVAFASGQYHVFGLDLEEGSPGLSLPAAPVALCLAAEIGLESASGLVALVPMGGTPASDQASQPSEGGSIEVLTNTPGRWQHLTTIGGVPGDAVNRLRATTCHGVLYLLVPGAAARPNRLAAWEGGQWRDLPLPPAMGRGEVVGLLGLAGRLTVVVATSVEGDKALRLEIAAMERGATDFVIQPVTSDGNEASWAIGDSPTVSVLGDKLAIVWRTGGVMKLATCSPATGRLDPSEDVKILQQPLPDDRGEQIREMALWAILLLILVPLFLLRPAGVPKPFSLPAGMVPALLTRRLAAAVVDLLPFHLAASLYLRFTLQMSSEDGMTMVMNLLRGKGPMPVQLAYAWAATIVLYLVYCLLMERCYAATVGKMLFKLRVVGDGGAPPGLREVLLRNLIKALEVFFFAPLLLAVLLNRYRQRLGDMAAHTTVIDARLLVPPAPPPMQ